MYFWRFRRFWKKLVRYKWLEVVTRAPVKKVKKENHNTCISFVIEHFAPNVNLFSELIVYFVSPFNTLAHFT